MAAALRVMTEMAAVTAVSAIHRANLLAQDVISTSIAEEQLIAECLANRTGERVSLLRVPWLEHWSTCDQHRVSRLLAASGYPNRITTEQSEFFFYPMALHEQIDDNQVARELLTLSIVTNHREGLQLAKELGTAPRLANRLSGADHRVLATILCCLRASVFDISANTLKEHGLHFAFSFEAVHFDLIRDVLIARGYTVLYYETQITQIWLFDQPMTSIHVVDYIHKLIYKIY